jgi:hypothetical protein
MIGIPFSATHTAPNPILKQETLVTNWKQVFNSGDVLLTHSLPLVSASRPARLCRSIPIAPFSLQPTAVLA